MASPKKKKEIIEEKKIDRTPKKFYYAKGECSLKFELRTDGLFQLKRFLELLKEAIIEVEIEQNNVIEISDCIKNEIEIKHKIFKQFIYTKEKITLDFQLRIDIQTEFKDFLGLLKSAVVEVEEEINKQ